MQVLDRQYALDVRAALEELLSWGPTESQAEIFLAALMRHIPSPEERYDTWIKLADLYDEVQHLQNGGDPGFDDLGGGHYITLDRETALQRAEADLDEALDEAVGISFASHPRVA